MLLVAFMAYTPIEKNTYTSTDTTTDYLFETLNDWGQFLWRQIQEVITMASSSSRSTILFTLLSLLVALVFTINSEAFRMGFQRRIVQPVLDASSPTRSATPRKQPRKQESLSSETSSGKVGKFWDDLQHPFGNEMEEGPVVESPETVHFVFLLHGHRGLSKDLSYLQVRMQQAAQEEKKALSLSSSSSSSSQQDMVVHLSVCNEGKTTDGISNGGDRLVEEMRTTIETEMAKRHSELSFSVNDTVPESDEKNSVVIYNISLSVLGNSLGGLFGRYAVAKLIERHCQWEKATESWILDGRFRLDLSIFCTTATPHLGISRHTYLKIPRTAEKGVAFALGDTGRDLFRFNDLLHIMSTSPTYLEPLGKFRKRIAYANAYGTDFAVPVSTAAFLSENSTYPHRIIETNVTTTSTSSPNETDATQESHGGLVIATLETPALPHRELTTPSSSSTPPRPVSGDPLEDELNQMSQSLDRLGWKKVFVDMRQELPTAELPSILRSSNSSSSLERSESNANGSDSAASDSAPAAIPRLRALQSEKRLVESREIDMAVSTPEDNRISLPLGHNMIVAFSRSPWSTFMNKGGRPVVDALAKELVQDIFTFESTKRALADDPSNTDHLDRCCNPWQQISKE